MFREALIVLAASLAFSGCSMIPTYQPPAMPVENRYPGVAGASVAGTADIAWRDFVSDERLRKLIDIALTNNRDLRVAVLNVEKSQAQYRVTRSSSFPTIDATGTFARSHAGDMTTDSWRASVGMTSYELDLFGRIRSLNEQALEKYFATDEARRSTQISLVAEVATRYFELRQAEEQIEVARQTIRAYLESYNVNKALFDAGAISALDVRSAEGQVETAQISLLTYQRQRAQAENALVLLIGQPLPAALPAPRAFNDRSMLAEISAGVPSELVLRRADILEAEHTLKAANANIGAVRAAFFPRLLLTTSIGTMSDQFSNLFGGRTGVWSFSPQITVPIFSGGQLTADLDAQKVSTRIEVANYEKAIQTAFREVADALVANSTYTEEIAAEAKLAGIQQQRLDLATLRYRHGEDSYLNVLSAQQELYSAQKGELQARYNKFASQIALYKAVGGGWK